MVYIFTVTLLPCLADSAMSDNVIDSHKVVIYFISRVAVGYLQKTMCCMLATVQEIIYH